jgi:uncharacterized protein
MLIVGGTFDAEDCFGAWNVYKAIEEKNRNIDNKIVMGPWFHGAWGGRGEGNHLGNVQFGSNTSEYYQQNIEIPFFNFYLKLKGTVRDIAEATVFFTGQNEWKKFEQWPPKNIENKNMFLTWNGMLTGNDFWATNKPNTIQKFTEYISDPAHPVPYTEDVHLGRTREYMTDDQRFASRRPDVLTFKTPILTDDLTIGGPVVADLMASITTTDADFVVKIIDVFPNDFEYEKDSFNASENNKLGPHMQGYQMLVRGEIMRGKFRNSFEKPEPFVPNKITPVKFTLPDVAHTFKKGHQLMIQIQSSWFPVADRNPQIFTDIYKCEDKDFQKSTIKIYHDGFNQSKIILPVLNK